MLVLDTGSIDDTPAQAVACGAQVAHATWTNDFSAARNTALDLSPADWHVVLDADEWVMDGGEALLTLRDTPPDFVGALHFCDQFFDGQVRQEHSWMSRVFPRHLRYSGCIHETITHDLPMRRLEVQIGHDGYLPEHLAAKQGRNRALLQAALADDPSDVYLWYQLGKDHSVYDEPAPAEAAFARAVGLDASSHDWWNDLVVRRLFTLKQLKRHGEGIEFAQQQLARCGDVPDYFFALGDLLLDLAADQPGQAPQLLPMMQAAWTRCLEIGERPDLSGAVAGRGSHLAAHNLALALDVMGRDNEARALRLRYPMP
jgi:glycosyltransferase involved in cell wall biosynthesis